MHFQRGNCPLQHDGEERRLAPELSSIGAAASSPLPALLGPSPSSFVINLPGWAQTPGPIPPAGKAELKTAPASKRGQLSVYSFPSLLALPADSTQEAGGSVES